MIVVAIIGIDACFPVSDAPVPTPEAIEAGGKSWTGRVAAVSERFGRPVPFTEWAYECEEYAGK